MLHNINVYWNISSSCKNREDVKLKANHLFFNGCGYNTVTSVVLGSISTLKELELTNIRINLDRQLLLNLYECESLEEIRLKNVSCNLDVARSVFRLCMLFMCE